MSDPSGKDDKAEAGHPRAEEFVSLFKRGLKFTEELLEENERLRFQIASLEAQQGAEGSAGGGGPDATIAALKAQVAQLEEERRRLLESFKSVEERNRDYQSRYAEIEEEHNNLANLYIASYQLHSTLAFREVVQVIAEIVINLVGVQRFSLMWQNPESGELRAIFAEGQDAAEVPAVQPGEGPVGKAVASGDWWARGEGEDGPVAVVPLATLESQVGAIVIEELLVQKPTLNNVDHELFTLLGAHAATAMLASLLRGQLSPGQEKSLLDPEQVKRLLGS